MKKFIFYLITLLCILGISGCSPNNEPTIKITYEPTPENLIEEYRKTSKEVTHTTYYEMSDGTWKTDEHPYKYRLEITGRMRNAVNDITYIILSNTEDITFDQAWKASGLSSNTEDYFKREEAVFVAVSIE